MSNTVPNTKQHMQSSEQLKPVDVTEDFLNLLKIIQHYWIIIVCFSIIGLIVGLTYSRYSRNLYECTTMLQLDPKSKNSKAIVDIGALFEQQSPAKAEILLIQSMSIMLPVVEKLHLNYTAEPLGIIDRLLQREGRMDLKLFEPPKTKDDEKIEWITEILSDSTYDLRSPFGGSLVIGKIGETYRVPFADDTVAISVESISAKPGQKFSLTRIPALYAAKNLSLAINAIEKEKNTNIIEISYMDRYPDRAAAVLNAIAETYVRQNVEMRSAEAEKSLEFLEQQLPSIKAKLDSAQQLLTNYRNTVGTVDLGAEAQGTLKRQVELKTMLLTSQQDYQEKSRLFKQDHPVMQALLQQQARLKKEIGIEENKTKKLPTTQQDVLKLQQDVEINNELYTSVLNNMQQLRVVRASEIGNVRIVDKAYIDAIPAKPNRKKIILAGFAGGLGFGCILVILLQRIRNRGVGSSTQIEHETGVSVYAKIPKTKINPKLPNVNDKRFILAKEDSEDIAIERIRTLRTTLEFSCLDEGGKVVMVTGISPGAGKSFISLNLAYLFAKQEKRVLFIDADLRKSRLSHIREKGVSDIISKVCHLEDVIINLGEGADFLPNGTHTQNPAEMLSSKAFAELIHECREKYDVVIIDTPPTSLVSDAQAIAKLADFGLIVIEYKKHSMENIQEAIDQISTSKLEKKAIVLNQSIHDDSSYGYGYGYGYSYGYKNRYRYGEKK